MAGLFRRSAGSTAERRGRFVATSAEVKEETHGD
jgi:hypothetical protein